MATTTRTAREWKIVHEWQVGDEFFRMPHTECTTEGAARQWCAAQLDSGRLEPGEGYFIRNPEGVVIHRTWRPL